jgi:lysyl-tRNA synthetase class 2
MFDHDLNEQQLIRRQKLQQLRDLGIDPYPPELYPLTTTAEEIKRDYPKQS